MTEPKRRLSALRVIIAMLLLMDITLGTYLGWNFWRGMQSTITQKPWFAPYVDVTATPLYAFEQVGSTKSPNVVLSFIVSSPTDACAPTWGAAYSLDQARGGLDLDRRIARLRQQGGNVAISFGGQLHDELALKCEDPDKLLNAYQDVINRYNIDTIDLDIEGSDLSNTIAMKRRASVIAKLQKNLRANKRNLAVWLTLPVAPTGLTEEGTTAVATMLSSGVDVAGVNVMTMDYSTSRPKNVSMLQASENALTQTHRQLGILYKQVGIELNDATLWRKIGATPMIGQNDIQNDIFTIDDAKGLDAFGTSQVMGRMSMWSANRDIQCGDNYVDVKIVSDSCSGVTEDKLGFTTLLSDGFTGDLQHNAGVVTTADSDMHTQQPDDPQKSPYQIWKESGSYLAGTKVVWHRNVYQAKWWTQGDMPDNPVLQAWQTPWQLLGPVLPGEKPIKQPTLPTGTYPTWSGTVEYDANQRVLFNGVPYQAKWWNKGESPAASTANPDSSPWQPLTQAQINAIVAENKASASARLKNK